MSFKLHQTFITKRGILPCCAASFDAWQHDIISNGRAGTDTFEPGHTVMCQDSEDTTGHSITLVLRDNGPFWEMVNDVPLDEVPNVKPKLLDEPTSGDSKTVTKKAAKPKPKSGGRPRKAASSANKSASDKTKGPKDQVKSPSTNQKN